MRGLGGSACDPSEHTCELSGERLKRYEAARRAGKTWWEALDEVSICDACKVFGTTGWKRRFRLEVIPKEGEIDLTEGMFPSGRVHPRGSSEYRVGGWMLRGGYFGTLMLQFHGDEEILCCEILPTLRFIEQWGALGPKTSLGYGVIKIEDVKLNGGSIETYDCCANSRVGRWWLNTQLNATSPYNGICPALTNMFFAKARFRPDGDNWWRTLQEVEWLKDRKIPQKDASWTGRGQEPKGPYKISNAFPYTRLEHWYQCHKMFPIAPIVRNRLRYGNASVCDGNGETDWCKFVFGTTQGKRVQSKIRVSWAYRLPDSDEWEFRIWGWLPEDTQSNGHPNNKRTQLLSNLRNCIGASDKTPRQWHSPQNGALWSALNLTPTQVCWFERQSGKSVADYLKALLNECKETSHGDTENTGR